MKMIVSKEGIITINPQDSDVISIVNLIGSKYNVDVIMQYKETNPVYYIADGIFFCGSDIIATYNQDKKRDFVKDILKYFKIDCVEIGEEHYHLPNNNAYLDTEYDDCVVLVVNNKEEFLFDDDELDDGIDGEISILLKMLGIDIKWTRERFPSGNVCECCYSEDMYEYEQDGDIKGDCNICGKTNMLHMR